MPQKVTIDPDVLRRAEELQEENLERFEQVYGHRPPGFGPKPAETKAKGKGTAKPKPTNPAAERRAAMAKRFEAWQRSLPAMGNRLTNPCTMTEAELAGVDSRLAEMARRDRKASLSTLENMKKLIASGYR